MREHNARIGCDVSEMAREYNLIFDSRSIDAKNLAVVMSFLTSNTSLIFE